MAAFLIASIEVASVVFPRYNITEREFATPLRCGRSSIAAAAAPPVHFIMPIFLPFNLQKLFLKKQKRSRRKKKNIGRHGPPRF